VPSSLNPPEQCLYVFNGGLLELSVGVHFIGITKRHVPHGSGTRIGLCIATDALMSAEEKL
jgi:hypothetical protein